MPTSLKQLKMMRGVAHDPVFAAKMGIPQSVGREFVAAGMPHDPKKAKIKKIADALKRGH